MVARMYLCTVAVCIIKRTRTLSCMVNVLSLVKVTWLFYACMHFRPDDEEDSEIAGYAKISQFFTVKSSPDSSTDRHRYFVERGLHVKTDL